MVATSVGPTSSAAASASGRIRPCSSTSISIARPAPSPSSRSDRSIVSCRSRPTSTRTGGQPSRPVGLHVPADPAQHGVASRGQAGEVGHHAAGDEADRRLRWQPEQVEQPVAGHPLGAGGRRRGHQQPGVLVPQRGQPVGPERGRQHPADHPAEEAAATASPPRPARPRPSAPRSRPAVGALLVAADRRAPRPPRRRPPGRSPAGPGARPGSRATPPAPAPAPPAADRPPLIHPADPLFSTPRVMYLPRSRVGTRVWSLPVRRASRFGRWATTV